MSMRKILFILAILVALTTLGFSHYTLIKTERELSKVEKQYHTIVSSLEKAEEDLAVVKNESKETKLKVVKLANKVKKQKVANKKQTKANTTMKKDIDRNKINIATLKARIQSKKQAQAKAKTQAKSKKHIETTQLVSKSSSPAGRSIQMEATGYTAYCNGCSGKTATGINLRANPNARVIAVDPSVIPLGTRVWVEGYGYAVAADKGGAINGNKIDVHFATKSQAYAWGRKTVLVKILN